MFAEGEPYRAGSRGLGQAIDRSDRVLKCHRCSGLRLALAGMAMQDVTVELLLPSGFTVDQALKAVEAEADRQMWSRGFTGRVLNPPANNVLDQANQAQRRWTAIYKMD